MPSVQAALSDFVQAIVGIASAIVNSVLGVFQANLALGQQLLSSVLHLFYALLQLVTDLTQGVVGFVFANFFALLVIGGLAYWYMSRQNAGGINVKGKRRA